MGRGGHKCIGNIKWKSIVLEKLKDKNYCSGIVLRKRREIRIERRVKKVGANEIVNNRNSSIKQNKER